LTTLKEKIEKGPLYISVKNGLTGPANTN
jgi:hypothetical protein